MVGGGGSDDDDDDDDDDDVDEMHFVLRRFLLQIVDAVFGVDPTN